MSEKKKEGPIWPSILFYLFIIGALMQAFDCNGSSSSSSSTSARTLQNGQIPGFTECLKAPIMFQACCAKVGGGFYPKGTSGKGSFPTCQKIVR